jgi:dTDP-4-amino-4,6-dideoxygalactose transaminase
MVTTAIKTYPLAHRTYGDEEIAAVVMALRSGRTTQGPRVAEFEQTFARYIGRKHAIMVNSGSSADLLLAFGLGRAEPGQYILVPAVTWPTQVSACLAAGYNVRLVDVDPDTLQFNEYDLDMQLRVVDPHAHAIFPVHVLGAVGSMNWAIKLAAYYGIAVIEDCCEALGSTYNSQHVGTFGYAAAFSFFFSHLITTMEGGMVVTDDDDAARRFHLLRTHGWEPVEDEYFHFPQWGFNLRPTELQGAFGNVQMGRLEEFKAARQRNFDRLVTGIQGDGYLTGIHVLPDCEPAWHGYPIMVSPKAPYTKKQLCRYLNQHGIETRPIIAGNLACQPAAKNDPRVIAGYLPGADAVHERGFYIGLASFDDPEGTSYVAETIHDFLRDY